MTRNKIQTKRYWQKQTEAKTIRADLTEKHENSGFEPLLITSFVPKMSFTSEPSPEIARILQRAG